MQWPLHKKIAFRFLFVYLLLYCWLRDPASLIWQRIVPWAGRLLGVNASHQFNGSGDATFHYVQVLCFVVIAAIASLTWSLADHKRPHYHRLYLWMIVLVRLSLGMTMISYGAGKVIQSQFPPLQPWRLLQPFGDASPMGLLWTFMGASTAYNVFTGAGEMLGGILVFFQRTATLGALICIGVISHVVALNFSYDVPVKLYSLHLLFMAILVAAVDAKRLANLFLLNRASEPAPTELLMQRPLLRRAGFALKMTLLVWITGTALYSSYSFTKTMTKTSLLHGTWEVDEFAQEGEVRPPLVTDQERWWRLIVPGEEFAFVQLMNNERAGGYFFVKPKDKKLYFKDQEFTYEQPTPDTLLVDGYFQGHNIRARLHRVDENKFPLLNRGFHWINEMPFNR